MEEFGAANTLRTFLGWCENPRTAAVIEEADVANLRAIMEWLASRPESLNAPVAPNAAHAPDSANMSKVEKLARLLKGIVRD
ncbi:MAG TPA: hypothetical protein PK988_10045 [Candidatus Sumerlaeota bacterium]|nr:hypothetical protein [Candidatus Sumerlaeota bacterium]